MATNLSLPRPSMISYIFSALKFANYYDSSHNIFVIPREELAKSLHSILIDSHQTYEKNIPIVKIEEQALTSDNVGVLTAGDGRAGTAENRSLRPGYTYTISSSGVLTQSSMATSFVDASSFASSLSPGVSATVERGNGQPSSTLLEATASTPPQQIEQNNNEVSVTHTQSLVGDHGMDEGLSVTDPVAVVQVNSRGSLS